MQIILEKKEVAALALHMQLNRKNIKRGFKSNYGSKEGKEVLASFDEVKSTMNGLLNLDGKGQDIEGPQTLNFNIKEIDMLDSFLSWYLAELDKSFGEDKKKMHKQDTEQIDQLESIKEKVDEMRALHA